jgi:hypothetical protein
LSRSKWEEVSVLDHVETMLLNVWFLDMHVVNMSPMSFTLIIPYRLSLLVMCVFDSLGRLCLVLLS